MNNRYLQDRAMRRRDRAMGMQDERNPYGSRGGYVVSSKRGRGRDRGMDSDYNYPEYDSRYYDRNYSQYSGQDNHQYPEQYGEYDRPMEYQMYGVGGIMPMYGDYNMDYARGNRGRGRDRNYDSRYGGMHPYDYAMNDYGMEEEEYKKELHKWTEKLKSKDRFRKEKNEIIQMARSMGAKFNKYNEDEFVAIYYMIVSDYRNELIPSAQQAILFAIDWLEDDDVAMKGSEKVCSYLYATVLGKED